MKRINTVVFDYDGTIHDTSKIYIQAFGRAYSNLVKLGYARERSFEDSEITRWLGCTAEEMWNTFMPSLPREMKVKSSLTIRACMAELIAQGKSRLYGNVRDTLTALNAEGRSLVILSNCAHDYMENHKKQFKLDELFDDFYCAGDYDFIPKEEIFAFIKDKYGGEYCMVGDRYHDIEAGVRCADLTVGCRYGFGTEEELSRANVCINDICELVDVIHKYEQSA